MSPFFCLTQTNKQLSIFCCLHLAGGDAEGGGVRVLVCAVFGDSGARRQHQPQQPGGSAGDASGGGRHIQPTRRVVPVGFHDKMIRRPRQVL